ncbi:MAG: GNAT family N-acetyltransferase [Lachnospiraceae bacterium]|nr:GNAT family N-acetyltransferase [Lachnospiraceae bacterium]
MQLFRVTKSIKEYKQIKKLYRQAFPIEERAPFWLLMKKAKPSTADFWALYDNENWVGIVYVIKDEELAYIFYLAIKPEERGKRYGGKAIDMLRDYYRGCKMFLALEALDQTADNYEQRVKRHSFYEKCGLLDMPYKIKEASVIYDIMGVGGIVEPEEYGRMMEKYLGSFFKRLVDVRILKDS